MLMAVQYSGHTRNIIWVSGYGNSSGYFFFFFSNSYETHTSAPRMDGCMQGWMDGWMDACMQGWMDGCNFCVFLNNVIIVYVRTDLCLSSVQYYILNQ